MAILYKHAGFEFTVIRRIGGGGFGEVFEVSLPNCPFEYALKRFSPKPHISNATCFTEDELVERFRQEIKYQTLCRHDNIAPIYVFHNEDNPFFIMDLAEQDLEKLIESDTLNQDEKIKVILDVIDGLEYLHSKGWVHRDIKPANILKFKDRYKLSDFGLIKNIKSAQDEQQVMTAIGIALGTKGYMAPEVLAACDYSVLSDIYALGVVINEMKINGLNAISDKCTMHRPAARFNSVTDLKKAILEASK